MVKKRMWLFALAAAILLAMLVGFFTLSGGKAGVYRGAKLVLYQDAFLRMPERAA